MPETFVHRSRMPAPAAELFAWHERPGAFERLRPPWQSVEVLESQGGIRDGGRVAVRTNIGLLSTTWRLEHRDYIAGKQFRDVQLSGPFRYWQHTHSVEPDGPDASYLEDRIDYELPLGLAGRLAGAGFARRLLERLFAYRHTITAADLAAHRQAAEFSGMQVAVSGASGLIGSGLVPFLTTGGHQVRRLVRGAAREPHDIAWDPAGGKLDSQALAGCDAVVHLAGESIAAHRWSADVKRRILDSRVQSTRLLASTLVAMHPRPKVWVCASAIGYYGDRGDELLDEASPPGHGFLPDVCRQWEAETRPAADAGIRVVNVRFGVVLSPAGGALKTMLPPFRMGLGGRLGAGQQYMSWIAVDDAIGAVHHALTNERLHGAVNGVAPHPVTNQEFTKTLGRVIHRPTLFPMPVPAVKLMFGELGEALLLASTRVHPARLMESAYAFRYPQLEAALVHVLGK